MLVNPNTGRWVSGGIDQIGHWHTAGSGTAASLVGETNLIATDSFLLSYASATGKGASLLEDSRGIVAFDNLFNFSAHWSVIEGIGNYLFFYDLPSGHAAAIVRTFPDGTLKQTFSSATFSAWSNIIVTDNYVFFYNGTGGLIATGEIDSSGSFIQSASGQTSAGYTLATSLNDDVLLYNRNNGYWESGPILYTGNQLKDYYFPQTKVTANTLGLGYSAAVQSNDHLLLYDSATGNAAIGHFAQAGTFILDNKQVLTKFFTHLVRCGHYLILYGYGTGTFQVGYITTDGKFQVTQTLTSQTGWWNVVATKN